MEEMERDLGRDLPRTLVVATWGASATWVVGVFGDMFVWLDWIEVDS